MKVNVLQVEEVKFKKYKFWSNWVDISVYNYASAPYLLQMSINRFNSKKFKSIRLTGSIVYRQATCLEIGDLTQMSKPNTINS